MQEENLAANDDKWIFWIKSIVIRIRSVAAAAAAIVTGFTLFPLFSIELFLLHCAAEEQCHPSLRAAAKILMPSVEITVKDTDSK